MFRRTVKNSFRDWVQGTWGSFSTPAGRIEYIMTKARLGEESQDPERLLTRSLFPVREIMDAGDLDFNQLLQRDLDDHRVATSLVPYLLQSRSTLPAFFPPILAVLLPFKDMRPSSFPTLEDAENEEEAELAWKQQQAGDAFQVRRVIDDRGEYHPVNLAQLRWNDSAAKLVVLDGQHRAMALLAIERTKSRTWRGSRGEKFRSFYEKQVQQYLEDPSIASSLDLEQIEVPVTVCWFPDRTGEGAQPHEAARKLFVDVNKEAKAPSESRIILLSDAELTNVLTRSMLSTLRTRRDGTLLPLYAVEYDNPDVNTSRPARWSVMTNVHLLKNAVNRCIFGPPKYLQDVTVKFGSRERKPERDAFMRKQLEVEKLFKAEFEDGGIPYRREAIGDDNFPLGKVDVLSDRFSETWGIAILSLLSKVAPYRAHARALSRMEAEWQAVEPFASLARDALFGGVGVYWTLKDSYEHYQDEKGTDGIEPTTARSNTDDVIRAWEAIQAKEKDFELLRAVEYLGSSKPEKRDQSKSLFSVMNTHACQLGLVMTMGTLWELRKDETEDWSLDDLPRFADALVQAWNSYFETPEGKGKTRDRRIVFSKNVTNPINLIPKLETTRAVFFRYFWLQALATPVAWPHVADWFDGRAGFDQLLSKARRMYLEFCADEQLKALRTNTQGDPNDRRLADKAQELAEKALRKALESWFAVEQADFNEWLTSAAAGAKATPQNAATESEKDAADSASVEEDESGPQSYEELLEED